MDARMKYRYGVYIGRFQPFHNGHLSTVKQGLEECEKLIMVLGSSNMAPNPKNPFSPEERADLIRAGLPNSAQDRVMFVDVRDYFYNDARWVAEVQNAVHNIAAPSDRVALIGYHKDSSSYYLDLFPEWSFIHAVPKAGLNATDVRRLYFTDGTYDHLVPTGTHERLETHIPLQLRRSILRDEYHYLESYKRSFVGPYPPIFVTADCVVYHNNHILVVERKEMPGTNLYALPGGFVQQGERIQDAAIRELKEETNIVLPEDKLRQSIVKNHVFDHPDRSLRGRTITHAFFLRLDEKIIPRVLGADDAKKALWLPVPDVYKSERKFFEDHGSIIDYFLRD